MDAVGERELVPLIVGVREIELALLRDRDTVRDRDTGVLEGDGVALVGTNTSPFTLTVAVCATLSIVPTLTRNVDAVLANTSPLRSFAASRVFFPTAKRCT
jgi:hypothetical protein